MKLTLEEIKKIARGALEVEEADGVFTFHRFEKEARDYYFQRSSQTRGK